MEKMKAYKILVGKTEGKIKTWVANIKMHLRERIGWCGLD
jgi:hypothetical protein